jgi:hypothetical protein
LFLLLSGVTRKGTVAYLDFSGSFFPASAVASGVDLSRVIVLCPNSHPNNQKDVVNPIGCHCEEPLRHPERSRRTRGDEAISVHDSTQGTEIATSRSVLLAMTGRPPSVFSKTTSYPTRPFTVALRSAELIFRYQLACCVVFDLIGEHGQLPLTLLHRLRMQTVRAKALVIFLTEPQSNLVPASTTSLKLQVKRNESGSLHVAVARSRISREGIEMEVNLHE